MSTLYTIACPQAGYIKVGVFQTLLVEKGPVIVHNSDSIYICLGGLLSETPAQKYHLGVIGGNGETDWDCASVICALVFQS